jgi:hypothetical protein
MTEGTGMWPNKRQQDLSDACDDARIRVALAMTDPKDTIELNNARAELTRLEQIVGAYTSPGGPRVYGSGCSANATGYRDLHRHGETGVSNPTYTADGYDPTGGHKYQKGSDLPETVEHHPHQPRDDGKLGGWFGGDGKRRTGWAS